MTVITEDPHPVPTSLVELLHALLAVVAERGDQELGVLTAEELASVTGAADELGGGAPSGRLVPLPSVDDLDATARAAATAAGRRGLIARGLLDHDLLDVPLDSAVPLERLRDALGLIVWLRAAPDALTWAERRLAAATTDVVFYGIADLAVLEERTTDDGLHRFTLRSQRGAAEALAVLADPDDRAAADGPPIVRRGDEDPPGWDTVLAVLDRAECVTQLGTVRRERDGGDRLAVSLVAGPDGVWVVGGSAPPEGVDEVARVAARPASATTLRDVALATLRFSEHGADDEGERTEPEHTDPERTDPGSDRPSGTDRTVTAGDGPRPGAHAPRPDG